MESGGEKREKYRKIKWAGIFCRAPGHLQESSSVQSLLPQSSRAPLPGDMPSHVNIPVISAHAAFLNYHSKEVCQPSHVMLDWGQVRGIKLTRGQNTIRRYTTSWVNLGQPKNALVKNSQLELERRFKGEEHWLVFQIFWVQFQATMWYLQPSIVRPALFWRADKHPNRTLHI